VSAWLPVFLMLVAGAFAGAQTPTNALLATAVKSPVNAAPDQLLRSARRC
jgi:uncharacterized membrane protein YdcZ (DUF606 family)